MKRDLWGTALGVVFLVIIAISVVQRDWLAAGVNVAALALLCGAYRAAERHKKAT
jgi:hypothetical protein